MRQAIRAAIKSLKHCIPQEKNQKQHIHYKYFYLNSYKNVVTSG